MSQLNRLNNKKIIQISLLVMLAGAIFSNTLHNDFIWDDLLLITDNRLIRDCQNTPLFFTPHYWNELHPVAGEYRPIRTVSFAADYSLWKLNPAGYRVTNLLLHVINVALVFYLVLFIADKKRDRSGGIGSGQRGFFSLAFLTALFFATHPIHTESINFVKNRSDLLALLFFLLSFILFIKHIIAAGLRDRHLFIIGAWISFALAVLSKQMALTLPGVLLLYTVCFVPGSERKRSLIGIIPYGVIVFAYFGFYRSFIRPAELLPGGVALPGDIGQHVLTVIKTMGCYFKLMVAPFPLNADHAFSIPALILTPSVLLSFIVLLLIGTVAIRAHKRSPVVFFALGWMVLTLLPVSNIVYLVSRPIAEQRLYIPSVGFCLLLAYCFERWPRIWFKEPHAPPLIITSAVPAVIIICFYVGITVHRNSDWRDGITLYSKTLAMNPNSIRAHTNLGVALNKAKKHEQAIRHFQAALHLSPNFVRAHNNWGVALNDLGRQEEAISHYQTALHLNPNFVRAHNNWGVALNGLGRHEDAINHYQNVLRLESKDIINHDMAGFYPSSDYINACYNLGVAFYDMGQYEEAISHYRTALSLDPDHIEAHYNLGLVFYKTEQYQSSINHYRNAVSLNTDHIDAHYNLGLVFYKTGRYEQAISHYQAALRLKPGETEILNNLGVAFYVTGRLDDALVFLQKALKISPDDMRTNMNMGKILVEKGRFEEALLRFSTILNINPNHQQARSEYAFCVKAIEQRSGFSDGDDRP